MQKRLLAHSLKGGIMFLLHLGNIGAVCYEVHESGAWLALSSVLVWAAVSVSAIALWREHTEHGR
jgi:hypothetical protein